MQDSAKDPLSMTSIESDDTLSRLEAGEGTPLVTEDLLPPLPETSWKEQAVTGFAGAGFLANVLALLFSPHLFVMISSSLGLLVLPYTAFQQRKITQTAALKVTNEALQGEVAILQRENDRLQEKEQELGSSVLKLEQLEQSLAEVRALGGASLKQLEDQLVQSREILKSAHANHKSDILQNLLTVLLTLDRDGNAILSDEEIDEVIHTMEGVHGVQFNEELLRKAIIDAGRSTFGILEVARNVLSDDTPADEIIFRLQERDLPL